MTGAAVGHARSAASPLAARFAAASLDWIVPEWPVPPNVHAFFTTRNGGVSTGACASLDVGTREPPAERSAREAIDENRRRIAAFLPSPAFWLEQVHGADVVIVDEHQLATGSAWPRADAAVTRLANVPLAVRVADCLPVLLADDAGSVVAIAHAGWRGLAAGVLESTVAATESDASALVAWLGPAIGRTAFEVGDDVREAFLASDPEGELAFVRGRPGKWHADLRALAVRRLAAAGVRNVHGCDACTFSGADRFFSYRRERATGRMAAFAWRSARVTAR
jgi:polyphenol oxidase